MIKESSKTIMKKYKKNLKKYKIVYVIFFQWKGNELVDHWL